MSIGALAVKWQGIPDITAGTAFFLSLKVQEAASCLIYHWVIRDDETITHQPPIALNLHLAAIA